MILPSTPQIAVAPVALAAALSDLWARRVPNALTLGAACVAIAMHGMLAGWLGLGFALSGWAVGAVLFFPFFCSGEWAPAM